jgi:hypothetical protein
MVNSCDTPSPLTSFVDAGLWLSLLEYSDPICVTATLTEHGQISSKRKRW